LHEETLKSHNALMNAFKSIEEEHGNTKVQSNQQIEALKSDHIRELKTIQKEFETQKN